MRTELNGIFGLFVIALAIFSVVSHLWHRHRHNRSERQHQQDRREMAAVINDLDARCHELEGRPASGRTYTAAWRAMQRR